MPSNLQGPGYGSKPTFTLPRRLLYFAKQLTWVALPAVQPLALWRALGLGGALLLAAAALVVALLGIAGWRSRPAGLANAVTTSTVIPWLLAAYVAALVLIVGANPIARWIN